MNEKIVTVRTNKIAFKEKEEKLGFWNNEVQNELRIFEKNLEEILLFRRAVKSFCELYGHVQCI